MSLVGYDYDEEHEDERRPRDSPNLETFSLVPSDYGDNSLSASGGVTLPREVEPAASSESRRARPTPVDSADPSPAAWMERTQDFYKSPNSFSPSRSHDRNADKSASPSVSRGASIDREAGSEPLLKRPRIDYSSWRAEYPEVNDAPDPALAADIAHEFDYKRAGKNINREIRTKKMFKNPDIIDLLGRQHNILEIGTNLSPEVFDPFAFPAEAFYDALEKKQNEIYLKEEEAKKAASQKGNRVLEFAAASKAGRK